MARNAYRNPRQQHLVNALDDLARRELLSWRWEYDQRRNRVVFHLLMPGQPEQELYTRSVERVVQALYQGAGLCWLPVPHPGGQAELDDTLRRMNAAR